MNGGFFFDEELLDKITAKLREFGFMYVTFDLLGYRSGSMNELITQTKIDIKTSERSS